MTQFIRAYPPSIPSPGPVRWFVFRGANVLLQHGEPGPALPVGEAALFAPLVLETVLHLGELDGVGCMAATVGDSDVLPAGFVEVGLRALYDMPLQAMPRSCSTGKTRVAFVPPMAAQPSRCPASGASVARVAAM
jgi:hypothetical protein